MINGMVQPPVSRLTVASVDKHCGANTYQASKESAVARLHFCAINGARACAVSFPVAQSAYTVPSALTSDEADVLQLVRPLRRPWRGYDVTDDKYVADDSICERHGLRHQR